MRIACEKLVLAPQLFSTDRSNSVVLMWFSVACFGVRVSVMFPLMFVHYTLNLVWVAELPPFAE